MAGYISKGITLSYKVNTEFVDLTNLQEIPDLGGTAESIEITTLADDAHMYMNGIKSYGDSLDFKFLYEPTQFNTLAALAGDQEWKVSLPDGENGAIDTTCTFKGTASVKIDSVGVNTAMTYTLSIKPTSSMVFA